MTRNATLITAATLFAFIAVGSFLVGWFTQAL
jgi:hypothetical protein